MVQKMWIRVTRVARAYNVARMFVICFKKIGVTITFIIDQCEILW